MYVYRDNKCTVWCQCGNCTHNYLWGTEDVEDLRKVCPKGAQRRSERKTLSWQQEDGQADQFRSYNSWCSGDLWWKLDLLLWPRDRVPSGSMLALPDPRKPDRANPPTNIWWSFFWQHWHDLHVLGSHWTDSQQVIPCWGFKGVQEEIPSEKASTLQIGSVVFPPGQCISPQLHPCHRLFDQDGHQDRSSASQTLIPMTFIYSLSSEAVVMRQLRRWKRLWRRSLTCSHKRTSMGPSRSWNGTRSSLQPEEITSKGTRVSCVYYQ